jgi:hypothetical protein
MRVRALDRAFGAVAACGCLLAFLPAAQAGEIRITAPAASLPAEAADAELRQPLTPEESDMLGRALAVDPATLASKPSKHGLRLPGMPKPASLAVNRTDKPDGSSTVAVNHPLAPGLDSAVLDATIGADVTLAAPPPSVYQPGKPLPGAAPNDSGSAAAWTSVGLPNFASVDARVDPANDQGKIGGTLKHAVPVGKSLSVTLEDRYAMTETLSPAAPAPAAPSVSSLAAPPPVTAPPQGPTQVFDNSKSVKLNIAPTGTTFGAGMTTASNDPVTHNTLSADQKLFGPLHVTTSVTDVGQPTVNKTISAGFKLNW